MTPAVRKEGIFWHHIHIFSSSAIDWAHARPTSCRLERRRRRALNLVDVCAVKVCRAEERDGMLTRDTRHERRGREKRRNLKAKLREATHSTRGWATEKVVGLTGFVIIHVFIASFSPAQGEHNQIQVNAKFTRPVNAMPMSSPDK